METIEYLKQIEPTERVKGVIRTENGWLMPNKVGDEYNLYELAYRRSSRLEIICSEGLDSESIEAELFRFSNFVE